MKRRRDPRRQRTWEESAEDEDYKSAPMKKPKRVQLPKGRRKMSLAKVLSLPDGKLEEALSTGRAVGVDFSHFNSTPNLMKNTELRPHQLEGLGWLANKYERRINCILADEMGLGKTIQTIALICHLRLRTDGINKRSKHVVLAPKSTLGHWAKEFERFAPSIKCLKFHGDREYRKAADFEPFDVIIATYEMGILGCERFTDSEHEIDVLAVDEGHRLKNEDSRLSEVMRSFDAKFRMLLTGTPLQNNLQELWALLNFLAPHIFHTVSEFLELFEIDSNQRANADRVTKLHRVLRRFMLRRDKATVMRELPPKHEIVLQIPMSRMQRKLYRGLLGREAAALRQKKGPQAVRAAPQVSRINNLVMRLRQVCAHPYLFEGVEESTADPFGEHVVENCGKLVFLDKILTRRLPKGHKVVIFTQFVSMLNILDDFCRMRNIQFSRIDGSTIDREEQIEKFQDPLGDKKVFILSTRAGGLGINLTEADTVIIYDSDWNPQMDLQAIDRAHRIGQSKEVIVYRLIHQYTIEEKMLERAQLKLQLDQLVIRKGQFVGGTAMAPKSKELMKLVRTGAAHVYDAGEDLESLTEEQLEGIFSKGEKAFSDLSEKFKAQAERSLLDFRDDLENVTDACLFGNVALTEDEEATERALVKLQKEVAEAAANAAQELDERKTRRQQLALEGQARSALKEKLHVLVHGAREPQPWQFIDRAVWGKLTDKLGAMLDDMSEVIDLVQYEERIIAVEQRRQEVLTEGFPTLLRNEFFIGVRVLTEVGGDEICNEGSTELYDALQEYGGRRSRQECHRLGLALRDRQDELPLNDFKRLKKAQRDFDRRRTVLAPIQLEVEKCSKPLEDLPLPHRTTEKHRKRYNPENDRTIAYLSSHLPSVTGERICFHLLRMDTCKYDWFIASRMPAEVFGRVGLLSRTFAKDIFDNSPDGLEDGAGT